MSSTPLTDDVLNRLAVIREHLENRRVEQAGYGLSKLPKAILTQPEVLVVGALYELLIGHKAAALKYARMAHEAVPTDVRIFEEYIGLLWRAGHSADAIMIANRYHEQHPNEIVVVRMLAEMLRRAGMIPHANAMAEKIIALEPETLDALFVRAYAASDIRRNELALQLFSRAAELAPADVRSGGGRLLPMLYAGAPPLEIRRVSEAWCSAVYGEVPRVKLPVRPRHGRKLRVGYVSGDFREHVVTLFFEGLLAAHDRSRVTVVGYGNMIKSDAVTHRLAASFDLYHNIYSLSDDAVTELIRADDIDVLIDLSGHTESNRLGVFARRAAPVQATYLGYPATTGLPEMDYRISDALADPPGMTDAFCTEKLYRLPRCAWAFHVPQDRAGDFDPRSPGPLGRGETFTFGSFNLLTKVDPSSTSLWGRALARCGTRAKLLMTDRRGLLANPEGVDILTREFAAEGAPLTQIMLASWARTPGDQLRRLLQVDLMLDPRAYNGTTTTCEALWHGVPSLTLPGTSHVSRVGLSLLTAMGLDKLIATSEEDFISKAVSLVDDPAYLIALRPTLQDRLKASPLGDHASLARAMEDAFEVMLDETARR